MRGKEESNNGQKHLFIAWILVKEATGEKKMKQPITLWRDHLQMVPWYFMFPSNEEDMHFENSFHLPVPFLPFISLVFALLGRIFFQISDNLL